MWFTPTLGLRPLEIVNFLIIYQQRGLQFYNTSTAIYFPFLKVSFTKYTFNTSTTLPQGFPLTHDGLINTQSSFFN